MIGISLKPKDLTALADLEKTARRMANPGEALEECGLVLLRSVAKNFDEGGRPQKWEPSLRATQARGKTLVQRGILKNSINMQAEGDKVIVGTSDKRARIHQLGGVIKPKNGKYLKAFIPGVGWRLMKSVTIPARPFLVVQDEDIRIFDRIIGDYATQ